MKKKVIPEEVKRAQFMAGLLPADDYYVLESTEGIDTIPFVTAEGPDHEVGMAQASLKQIISSASQLMNKIGNQEINLPGWIQDHITNAENYISQANKGYHQLEEGPLDEVGDSTNGYDYKEDWRDGSGPVGALTSGGDTSEWGFEDEDGDTYYVVIYSVDGYLDIDFGMTSSVSNYAETNKGKQFKIMATISNIVKHELSLDKKGKIKGVSYKPTSKSGENPHTKVTGGYADAVNQRDKLYRAFISKAIPSAEYSVQGSTVFATIPKNARTFGQA